MFERHYEDEDLIALLASNRRDVDTHLPGCAGCSDKAEDFRTIAGLLSEADVWDSRPQSDEPSQATISNLRAFADRMTSEDERAAFLVKELLDGDRAQWMPRLRAHPEWRTAGVVRKLMSSA